MNTEEILKEILVRLKEQGYCQVSGYKSFGFVKENPKSVVVSREAGKDTPVPFAKLKRCIEVYKANIDEYNAGPTALRKYGITHINSPLFSLLHIVDKTHYQS